MSQNGYTSWYLPYGDYMIQEDLQQSKPYYTYTENNISHTIYCAPSQEEIKFTINEENAGKTLSLKAHNSPNGSIRCTKYGDTNHNGQIDAEDEKLEGATFRLYTDEACKAEALGGNSLRTTDAQGLCAWEYLAPVSYTHLDVYKRQIYSEVVKNVPLGTYKIYKTTDFDGNGANVPLGGAIFELYQCGDTPDAAADCVEKNLVSAQTTDEGGNAQWPGLLPGEYWLKEITAEGHQLMAENPRRVSVKPCLLYTSLSSRC